MEKEEFSLKKATTKFAIRFIVLCLVITIIGTIVALSLWAVTVEGLDYGQEQEMIDSIGGLAFKLIIVDILAAIIATFFAVKKVCKKYKIDGENINLLKRNMAIVIVIVAVIIFFIHLSAVSSINTAFIESTGFDVDSVSEILEDIDDYTTKLGYSSDAVEEAEDCIETMVNSERVYEFSAVIYLLMIPASWYLLKKQTENA